MDKIQIYFTAIMLLSALVAGMKHGKVDEKPDHVAYWIVSVILSLPYIGRIYGWW